MLGLSPRRRDDARFFAHSSQWHRCRRPARRPAGATGWAGRARPRFARQTRGQLSPAVRACRRVRFARILCGFVSREPNRRRTDGRRSRRDASLSLPGKRPSAGRFRAWQSRRARCCERRFRSAQADPDHGCVAATGRARHAGRQPARPAMGGRARDPFRDAAVASVRRGALLYQRCAGPGRRDRRP